MPDQRLEASRFFLKDLIRQQVDFSQTAQSRRLPAPPGQKPCPAEVVRIDLPDGREALDRLGRIPLGEAIFQRKSIRNYSTASLSLEELSFLLFAAQGVRQVLGASVALRTVPSAGARHAFETYVVVNRVDSLSAGIYRYLPFDGQLARLGLDPGIGLQAAAACLGQKFIGAAAVSIFWTVIPERTEWRYGIAAHKVIAIDVGHVGQNLYLAGQAIDAGICTVAAYDQTACDRLLGVDGVDEFTIYIAAVGKLPPRSVEGR